MPRLAPPRRARRLVCAALLLLPLGTAAGLAGGCWAPSRHAPVSPSRRAVAATARYLERIRDDPVLLARFLRAMPKGGDLHVHLRGAVHAEELLRWAAVDGQCLDLATGTAVPPPCDAAVQPPASTALEDEALRAAVVDAWSMRGWRPGDGTGGDHLFGAFHRFAAVGWGREGDMLASVAARAAAEHLSYLEIMIAPGREALAPTWRAEWDADLGRMRRRLLESGSADAVVSAARAAYDAAEERMRQRLACRGGTRRPGCDVTIRYLYPVLRSRTPAEVFGQLVAGFEVAAADPRVVGVNLVQREDHDVARRDYGLHMRMIAFLRAVYPGVEVSLHAGELAPGLAPQAALRSHIRDAVMVAGARRIGHGADVEHESDTERLLALMARCGVLVEVCLSSNDAVLGLAGERHPLRRYLDAGVPVALATDDAGVLRSDMTGEYVRAVREHDLGFRQIVQMARNSLEYAFVEGDSLWRDPRRFVPVPQCAAEAGDDGAACRDYLARSRKARLQWRLERELAAFAARMAQGA